MESSTQDLFLAPGGPGVPMVSQLLSVPASFLALQIGWRINWIDLQGITKPLDETMSCTGFGWPVGRTFLVKDWQGLRP